MADETDAGLLVYMALAEEDAPCARTAWDVFYQRHVEYMYRVCFRAYGDLLGGQAGAADLTADVFRAAYENAHKFDPAGITDPERLRLRARAWMGWIARRIVQDILRSRARLGERKIELDHWQQIADSSCASAEPSARETLVRRAVEALTEREQVVIRTTFQWYRPEKDHQRLPNEIADELARTLNTTPENLRQIRRRAMRKIAEFFTNNITDDGKKESSHEE
ncbi:MAG: sigma-70 family RNA polymerase sigma factor [Phycisphaerae bacterium]|nr:sigma-70 family RNA polymerase sigma factor [Phycisphaerae bacterium]